MSPYISDAAIAALPIGIYVHVPFCRVRCSYCPFAISTDLRKEESYFEALLREVTLDADGERVDTLYLGGGTPSRVSTESLRTLNATLRKRFDLSALREFTIEANPEDVDPSFIHLVEELGVTRVSLGVQSIHDSELAPIGRGHAGSRALAAIELLVAARLRVSADLIIGLPAQTPELFRQSVEAVVERQVGHISLYMLDLEEGTALADQVRQQRVVLPSDDSVADLYLEAIELLAANGLHQYEISNFARPGDESLHNIGYWTRRPYKGYGMGAHAFDGASRVGNERGLDDYVKQIVATGKAVTFRETLTQQEAEREELFLSLRRTSGIGYADLIRLRGAEGETWVERGKEEGWLREEGTRISFTPRGFALSSELIAQLF